MTRPKTTSTKRPKAQKRSRANPRSRQRPRRGRIARAMTAFIAFVIIATMAPIAVLRWVPPLTTAFMWQSRTADPATGRPCPRVDYHWTPWRHISSDLPRAILVAEDQRFFAHRGFDTKAIGQAVDGHDVAALHGLREHDTSANGVAIEQHRARAALALAAPLFYGGEQAFFAQHVEQALAQPRVGHFAWRAVDVEDVVVAVVAVLAAGPHAATSSLDARRTSRLASTPTAWRRYSALDR